MLTAGCSVCSSQWYVQTRGLHGVGGDGDLTRPVGSCGGTIQLSAAAMLGLSNEETVRTGQSISM